MKLSEFSKTIYQRWQIFKANNKFAIQKEMAYAGNNWAGVISTTFYTLSMLLFVDILFGNTKQIAGYNQNQMLFFFFMAQLTYYLNWYTSVKNLFEMARDVNQGNLDMILIKPIPTLFYLTSRNIGGFSLLVDAVPPTLAIVFTINWPALLIHPANLIYGSLIFIFGLICIHVFQFLAAIPVFWLGESESIVDLAVFATSGSGTMIPLEGYSINLQRFLGTIIPMLITTAFSTSVILGKGDPIYYFIWSFVATLVAIIIRKKAWNFAIKNYTSASS